MSPCNNAALHINPGEGVTVSGPNLVMTFILKVPGSWLACQKAYGPTQC